MKTTIYELLGMVKDGKAPKKIKYDGQEYKITKILLQDNNYYFNYINEDMECIFPINTNHLNDEVEILEEPKGIPEKINCWYNYNGIDDKELTKIMLDELKDKINEILDYLESKGE